MSKYGEPWIMADGCMKAADGTTVDIEWQMGGEDAGRAIACVNALAHVPDGILANMPGKRYLLTFDTIEEAEKLIQMFKDHEEDQ